MDGHIKMATGSNRPPPRRTGQTARSLPSLGSSMRYKPNSVLPAAALWLTGVPGGKGGIAWSLRMGHRIQPNQAGKAACVVAVTVWYCTYLRGTAWPCRSMHHLGGVRIK